MKDVVFNVAFVGTKKPEAVAKLRAEITAYLRSINLLLGIKLDALAEERARKRFETLSTTLGNLQIQNHAIISNVATLRGRVEEGTQIVREEIERSSTKTNKSLHDIHTRSTAAVIEILKKVGLLSHLTVITYARINEIYEFLFFLRSNLSKLDTRHTYLQEPMRFEDAYGRKTLVERDMWQLFETSNAQNVLSASNWEPLPGMEITMAMIVPRRDNSLSCPRLNCLSKASQDAPGGGTR
ncbi:hypothetical protein IFR05_005831 [Cadophora sp. M221]|nr:hypothetical protein IFR05_005831 [Cadophora sp. M221]